MRTYLLEKSRVVFQVRIKVLSPLFPTKNTVYVHRLR